MKIKLTMTAAVLVSGLVFSACSLFGGDDGTTDLSTEEQVTPEPTTNNVQTIPLEDEASQSSQAASVPVADAPLPTAVTIPPTEVPPTPTPDRSQPSTYVVKSGDVLGLIAERYDIPIADLREANDLNGNTIKVGQSLIIPALDGSTSETDETAAAPALTPTPAPASAPAAPVSCGAGATGHCVQSGDSLLSIATEYGVSVSALRSANPSISGDLISIGSLLTIPGGPAASNTTTTTTTTTTDTDTTGTDPVATAGVTIPTSDEDCRAINEVFPYHHLGTCYANPFGETTTTPIPTATLNPDIEDCPTGYFLWNDGICYPIPGPTATPSGAATATPTPLATAVSTYGRYGTAPCRDGYELLTNLECWPAPGTTPTEI